MYKIVKQYFHYIILLFRSYSYRIQKIHQWHSREKANQTTNISLPQKEVTST
jgi:hypothetical protein